MWRHLYSLGLALTLIAFSQLAQAMPMKKKAGRAPASTKKFICHMAITPDGLGAQVTATDSADTLVEAREKTMLKCGNRVIDLYFRRHSRADAGVADEVALACVNADLECRNMNSPQ
jgi:hypothetical protein